MATSKVPFTVRYSKFGTRPPVFVAGTFTDPEWVPQEMQHAPGTDGELIFTSQIFVKPGTDYQFKFRLGLGEWWVLDENLPIVYDEAGNQNNLLKVARSEDSSLDGLRKKQPAPRQTKSQERSDTTHLVPPKPKSLAASLASDLEVQADDERSSTPIAQVANTAAEVADTAALLDRDEDRTPRMEVESDDELDAHRNTEYVTSPLFAHECLGAYEFVDEGSSHEPIPASDQRRFSKSIKDTFLTSDPDLEDPTLEKFPSDRSSIFDALRKIQTTLDDDVIQADGPFATSYDSSSRTSFDSADDFLLSPTSLSPTSTRRRDSRQSHSSVGRNRSAVSLGSIAEEDQQRNAAQAKSKPSAFGAKDQTKNAASAQQADDDPWLTIGSTKTGRNLAGSGRDKNMMQPRTSSKKSGKTKGSGADGTASSGKVEDRGSSYPKFITNVFDDNRANLFAAGGLLALALGIVWLQSR